MSLFEAIKSGDLAAVEAALAAGADPTSPDAEGRLALVEAIRVGHDAIVRALLGAGADPNALTHGRTALSLACAFRFVRRLYRDQAEQYAPTYERIARDLIAAGADIHKNEAEPRFAPIHDAITHGAPSLVEVLLAAGAKIPTSALEEVIAAGDSATALSVLPRLELDADARDSLLLAVAAAAGDDERDGALVEALIAEGASPNASDASSGATALHHAAYRTSAPVIVALVRGGADLDAKTTDTWYPEDSPKRKGTTPRGLLDAALAHDSTTPGSAEADPRWIAIAAALGTDVPSWIARVSAPARGVDAPAGRWVATMAELSGDDGDCDVLPDEPPVLVLGTDGRFEVVGSGAALTEGKGTWALASLSAKAKKTGVATPLDLQFEDELAGTEWRISRSKDLAELTLDVDDEEGRNVRWTFERRGE
jgi:ankyrin repeat protein